MAPVVLNNAVSLQSAYGQQLWSSSGTIRKKESVNFYEPNQSRFLSGPASLIIFINAYQLAYTVKMGKYRPGTPEYKSLVNDLKGRVPLRLKVEDIIDGSTLAVESTMRDLKRIAADTKLFSSVIWYAYNEGMGLSVANKAKMDDLLIGHKHNYKVLNQEKFKVTMKTNLQSHWRVTSLIANFDSCLLYGLQNECGSHYSLLAGYHEASQHVLVLDVKYGSVWVKVDSMMNAMHTISTESGFPRGLIEVDMVMI